MIAMSADNVQSSGMGECLGPQKESVSPGAVGALAGQLGRCLKTIDEIGPHEDRVLFQARQCTALSPFKVRTMVILV